MILYKRAIFSAYLAGILALLSATPALAGMINDRHSSMIHEEFFFNGRHNHAPIVSDQGHVTFPRHNEFHIQEGNRMHDGSDFRGNGNGFGENHSFEHHFEHHEEFRSATAPVEHHIFNSFESRRNPDHTLSNFDNRFNEREHFDNRFNRQEHFHNQDHLSSYNFRGDPADYNGAPYENFRGYNGGFGE